MAVTKSTTVSPSKQDLMIYVEQEMLSHAEPVLVLEKLGQIKPVPKNKGRIIEFRRPRVWDANTTPLAEGVTPAPRTFSYDHVSCTLSQFGEVSQLTDVIEETYTDPVLNDMTMITGENAGRSKEQLIFGVVKAGTNVVYANDSSRAAVNTVISRDKLDLATRSLRNNKAMRFTKILDGSTNTKTSPIEASYIAVCHTDLEHDLENLPGFVPVAEYGNRKLISEYEYGAVGKTRFITTPDLDAWASAGGTPGSTVLSTDGSSADVYPVLIFGREAFGCCPLRGQGAIEPTVIPVGNKTKDDPLGQRGYVGYKFWHGTVVLNEGWMVRLEVGASALS